MLTITFPLLDGWISGPKFFLPWHPGYEVNANPCHVSKLSNTIAAMIKALI